MKRTIRTRKSALVALLGVGIVCLSSHGFANREFLRAHPAAAVSAGLMVGDIVIADAKPPFGASGGIIRLDPVTGAQTTISSGGFFVNPAAVAIASNGDIYVVDANAFGGSGGVIRVDPATGAQTMISSGGLFVYPLGIAIATNGDIYVADANAFGGPGGVIRVDPATGAQTAVSSGNFFVDPGGIAVTSSGDIVVADAHAFGVSPFNVIPGGAVIRVNPVTGAQTVVSSGGDFFNPVGIALDAAGQILVADINSLVGGGHICGGGIGAVLSVDPSTGAQTVVSVGGPFTIGAQTDQVAPPRAVALEANGSILAVAPLVFGRFSSQCLGNEPGGVIRIDPATGAQSILSFGELLVLPVGIAVVQRPANQAPTAVCRNVSKSADSTCQATLAPQEVDNGSFDPDGDPISLSLSPAGPFALGTTTVTLTATDSKGAASTCTATVTAVDLTPPASGAAPDKSVLWPPNHEMVDVTINYSVTDNCDPASAVTCSLSVSANEGSSGDWEVVDPHHLRLRAERLGSSGGRVYTITITCIDRSGNSSSQTVTVTVPHDQGGA